MRRLAALLGTGAAMIGVAPGTAWAHAALVQSTPLQNAEVRAAPGTVQLDFSEPIEASAGALRVFDAAGKRVDTDHAVIPDGRQSNLAVPLRPGLPRGVYTATYRIISADGHPVSGGFSFGVGTPVTAASRARVSQFAEQTRGGPVIEGIYGVARGLHFAALMLLIGALFTRVLVWPAKTERRWPVRIVGGAVALGLVCAVYGVALQGALASGVSLGHALDAGVLRSSLDTQAGHTWLLRALAWAFAGLLLTQFPRLETRLETAGLALPALILVISLPLAGHAATNSPSTVLAVADVLHVLAAGAWLGGLVLLLACFWPRRRSDEPAAQDAAEATARFSRMAVPAIGVLVAAGLLQAVVYVGSVPALVRGTYGFALMAKVILLAGIVALGARNRRHTPRLRHGDAGAAAALRRSMRAEVVLAALVLAATATLVRAQPPADALPAPVTRDILAGPLKIHAVVNPARVGSDDVTLDVFDRRTGAPVGRVDELKVAMTQPARGIGPIRVEARRDSPGHYRLAGVPFGVDGRWQLAVTARVSEFDEYSGTADVPVAR